MLPQPRKVRVPTNLRAPLLLTPGSAATSATQNDSQPKEKEMGLLTTSEGQTTFNARGLHFPKGTCTVCTRPSRIHPAAGNWQGTSSLGSPAAKKTTQKQSFQLKISNIHSSLAKTFWLVNSLCHLLNLRVAGFTN